MGKFILVFMLLCSLLNAEVYLYKYNKDGTPYSKTEEVSGKVYIYTDLYKDIERVEISTQMIDEIKKSDRNENLYSAAIAFCSAWNDILQKDKTCKEFAYKVVGKELSPHKIYSIDIYRAKSADYRWISKDSYLELQ